jgi:hypothetical protein
MPLDDGHIRFIEAADGRGDGVAAVEFSVTDPSAIITAAKKHKLSWSGNETMICGTRFRFKELG